MIINKLFNEKNVANFTFVAIDGGFTYLIIIYFNYC